MSQRNVAAAEAAPLAAMREGLRGLLRMEESGLLLGLVILALVIGLPNPEFFDPRALTAVLRQSAFNGIVAFGVVFLIAMIEIDLSVGTLYGLSATIAAAAIRLGIDPWTAAAAAIAASAALGALNGAFANLLGVPIIIVSLGTLTAFRGAALVLSNGRAITGMPREHPLFHVIGGSVLGLPTPVWIMAATGLALHVVLARTRFGATVRAIGSNALAAQFIGVRVARTRVLVTALLGALCGLSGVLTLAFFKASDPSLGAGLELQVVAAVVIGGTSLAGGSGTMLGALIGVLLIALIGSGLVFFGISADWGQLVTGVVILAAIALDRTVKRRHRRITPADL